MSRHYKTNRKNRAFQLETLERREMMSATPWQTITAAGSAEQHILAVGPMTPGPQAPTAKVQLLPAGQLTASVDARPFVPTIQSGVLKIQATQADRWIVVTHDLKTNELVVQASAINNNMAPDGPPLRIPRAGIISIEYHGTDGKDRFGNGTNLPSTAFGYKEYDIFDGGIARDEFHGGDGPDEMRGGGGNDELFGDAGVDRLYGDELGSLPRQWGADTLHGGSDTDWLYGGGNNDTLFGDEGPDILDGQLGADILYAEPGIDTIKNPDPLDVLIRPTFLKLEPVGSMRKYEGRAGVTTEYTFRVTRTGNTDVETIFTYRVTGTGTHKADGADFVGGRLPAGNRKFVPGETTMLIVIKVAGDATVERDELFTLTLSNASGPTTITNPSVNGRIRNDD